jgi:hypothetical protein
MNIKDVAGDSLSKRAIACSMHTALLASNKLKTRGAEKKGAF